MQKLYKRFRNKLTDRQKGKLSQLAFLRPGKPSVRQDDVDESRKFPNGEKGGVIISADFELAWAWRYTKTQADYMGRAKQGRENFPAIIELLDSYHIPITFATVGHLFLENCRKGDHDWMARIPHFDDHWRFAEGDWFDHDPFSNYTNAPEWYAPDLIHMILDSEVNHEIGTHTFTHIDFTYKNCPDQVADDELKACMEVAKPYGIELNSLVFPGGTWGNIEVLKKNGIKIYRKNVKHDLAYPWRDEYGLLVTNSSGALEHSPGYSWSSNYFINRLKKYIIMAIQTNTIAHFWFHPSLDPYFIKNIFPPILEFAAEKRGNGELWIGTMKNIADHIESGQII